MPLRISWSCRRETRPTWRASNSRSIVTSCETFATEFFERPVLRFGRDMLPGASAQRRVTGPGNADHRVKQNRSEVYRRALEDYVARHNPDQVREALDRVLAEIGEAGDEFAGAATARVLEQIEW